MNLLFWTPTWSYFTLFRLLVHGSLTRGSSVHWKMSIFFQASGRVVFARQCRVFQSGLHQPRHYQEYGVSRSRHYRFELEPNNNYVVYGQMTFLFFHRQVNPKNRWKFQNWNHSDPAANVERGKKKESSRNLVEKIEGSILLDRFLLFGLKKTQAVNKLPSRSVISLHMNK